eukprot:SAG22_NODE_1200_length_5182_cov_4.342514_2_plen_342_part_00
MPAEKLGTTMFSGHMHTNRTLPVNNKLCNQRWVDRCQQLHKLRLENIKPAIDNKPPTRYKHLFQNLKKAQLEDGGPTDLPPSAPLPSPFVLPSWQRPPVGAACAPTSVGAACPSPRLVAIFLFQPKLTPPRPLVIRAQHGDRAGKPAAPREDVNDCASRLQYYPFVCSISRWSLPACTCMLVKVKSPLSRPILALTHGHCVMQHNHAHLQMESGKPEMTSANTVEFMPGVRIDRHQYPMVDHYKRLEHKSLNKEARRRELLRITADNQAILRRIQERQPFYNHLEWEQQRIQNEKYLRNISQFPESLPSMTGSGGFAGEDGYGAVPEEPMFDGGEDGAGES